MSVYIKGFPPPNNCGACPLRLAWCRERIYMVTRPERCPLVPVPEHGDLIERDKLRSTMYHEAFETDTPMQRWDSGCWIRYKLFENNLESAPTIIPADKEGEGC